MFSTSTQNVYGTVDEVFEEQRMKITTSNISSLEDCDISYIEEIKFADVVEINTNVLKLTNVLPSGYAFSDSIYGERSFATASASAASTGYLLIGDRPAEQFDEFNQLVTIEGNLDNKFNFIQDEPIETASNGTGRVHSYKRREGSSLDHLYLYKTRKNILTPGNIIGKDSEAVFEATDKYLGDLVTDRGELVYSEQADRVPRNDDTSETFKLAIKF